MNYKKNTSKRKEKTLEESEKTLEFLAQIHHTWSFGSLGFYVDISGESVNLGHWCGCDYGLWV